MGWIVPYQCSVQRGKEGKWKIWLGWYERTVKEDLFYMSFLRSYLFAHTSPFVLFSIHKKGGNASLTISWEGSLKKCSSCCFLNMQNDSRKCSIWSLFAYFVLLINTQSILLSLWRPGSKTEFRQHLNCLTRKKGLIECEEGGRWQKLVKGRIHCLKLFPVPWLSHLLSE